MRLHPLSLCAACVTVLSVAFLNDGQLFDMRRDRREMHPIDRADQSPPAAAARQQLQDVLTHLKIE